MALRVWLPLNGNTKNKGLLGDITITAAPTYTTTGKIGQALATGGLKMLANQTEQVLNNNEVTIAFWIYVKVEPTDSTKYNAILFGQDAMTPPNNRKFSIFQYPTCNDLHLSWQNETSGTFIGSIDTGILPSYKWTHVCVVYKNPTVTIYINGEEYTTHTGVSNSSSFSFDTQLIHSNSNRYINDFRIYDEALSVKQVKEIAKGLAAHYKLSAPNINNNLAVDNPLINSGATSISYDRYTYTYTIVSPVGDSTWGYGLNIGSTNKCLVPWDTTYRFSFEVWIPTQHEICIDYNNYANEGSSWGGNDNDLGSARISNVKIIPGGVWTKCVFGSKNAHTSNTNHVDIYEVSKIGLRTMNDTASTTWYLRNFKFELGDVATDFVLNDYSWDKDLNKDTSGNGYDGAIFGILKYNSNSAKYSSSTNFSTPGYIHYLPSPINSSTDAFTFTCWFYPTQNATMALYNDRTAVGDGFSVFYLGSGIRFDTGASAQFQSGTITVNAWNFVACVFDKNNNVKKTYINGAQVGSTSTIGSLANVGTNASIGNSSTNGAAGAGNQIYGSLNDVRIYATALSADDILTMYKNSGIIDNKGNVYAYEFKEE